MSPLAVGSLRVHPTGSFLTQYWPISTAFAINKTEFLDIIAASAVELNVLPGSGEAYSENIIEGRSYKRKD